MTYLGEQLVWNSLDVTYFATFVQETYEVM